MQLHPNLKRRLTAGIGRLRSARRSVLVAWAFGVAAVAGTVAGIESGFFGALAAGSWPDWFAAVGTVATFGFGAWVYWRSQQDAQQSQARLVHAYVLGVDSVSKGDRPVFPGAEYIEVGEEDLLELIFPPEDDMRPPYLVALRDLVVLDVQIDNNSDELVNRVVPTLLQTTEGDEQSWELTDVSFLPPKSSAHRYAVFALGELRNANGLVAAVEFFDAADRHWYRDQRRPLRRSQHRRP